MYIYYCSHRDANVCFYFIQFSRRGQFETAQQRNYALGKQKKKETETDKNRKEKINKETTMQSTQTKRVLVLN